MRYKPRVEHFMIKYCDVFVQNIILLNSCELEKNILPVTMSKNIFLLWISLLFSFHSYQLSDNFIEAEKAALEEQEAFDECLERCRDGQAYLKKVLQGEL